MAYVKVANLRKLIENLDDEDILALEIDSTGEQINVGILKKSESVPACNTGCGGCRTPLF